MGAKMAGGHTLTKLMVSVTMVCLASLHFCVKYLW